MFAKNLLETVSTQARQSYEIWAPYSGYYAIVAVLLPLAYIYDEYVAQSCYNTLPIRIAMAVPMVVVHFSIPFPSALDKHAHTIWALSSAFVLSFGFGHILVQTAACETASSGTDFYVIQYVTALFLLIQISGSVQLALALWITGTIPVVALYAASTPTNPDEVYRVTVLHLGVYATVLIGGSLAAQTNRLMEQGRARVGQMIGANIAHELRTPLATIRACASGSLKHHHTLLQGYTQALNTGLVTEPLRKHQLSGLTDAMEMIRAEVDDSNILIDILLLNTGLRSVSDYRSTTFSAKLCASEALERYPYSNSKERALASLVSIDDFEITAPQILVTHVILNLLKNGIYYSQKNSKPNVKIEIGRRIGRSSRNIVVTDNGPGVTPKEMKYIFNRYYTTTRAGEGAGVGLSFCRMVMDGIGGSIECKSNPDFNTEFVLHFPSTAPSRLKSKNEW